MKARPQTKKSDISREPTTVNGKLNPNVAGLEPSATLAINERSAQLISEGREIIRLGLGQSPFPVPPSVADALRQNAHQKAYLPVQGLPELCDAIAGYFHRTQGLGYSAEQILVGPGTKELMFLLQLVYAGDLVIPAPSWVSYAPQAGILGRDVRWLHTDFDNGLRLTPETLESLCQAEPDRPRLLILNYPCNPTGATYSADQLEAIADVARQFGVLILSDEIYSGLDFDGRHVSIARFYAEGTIVSDGLSKWCGAGGWRLGAFAFPKTLDWLQHAMVAVASETFTSVSAPVQYAAIKGFSGGDEIDDYVDRSRKILRSLLSFATNRLRDAGATVCEPQGAFYLFPQFDTASPRFVQGGRPSTAGELCNQILDDTGVAVLPGNDFGRPPTELVVRIAAVDFDGEAALNALQDLPAGTIPNDEFLDEFCQPTVRGINRLYDWLTLG
jgi:aspartate aminotransferase